MKTVTLYKWSNNFCHFRCSRQISQNFVFHFIQVRCLIILKFCAVCQFYCYAVHGILRWLVNCEIGFGQTRFCKIWVYESFGGIFMSHQLPGPWFNTKMTSYQYRKSHCGDKTIFRPSYLHNGFSSTDKMTSLYWIKAQGAVSIYRCHLTSTRSSL